MKWEQLLVFSQTFFGLAVFANLADYWFFAPKRDRKMELEFQEGFVTYCKKEGVLIEYKPENKVKSKTSEVSQ